MTGHGWVIPNKDGIKARCGGPGMCATCNREVVMAKSWEDIMKNIHEVPDERVHRALFDLAGKIQVLEKQAFDAGEAKMAAEAPASKARKRG